MLRGSSNARIIMEAGRHCAFRQRRGRTKARRLNGCIYVAVPICLLALALLVPHFANICFRFMLILLLCGMVKPIL